MTEPPPLSPLSHFTGILADRYLALTLADLGATFVLLIQAPILGGVIGLAWRDGTQNPAPFNLTLAFSAVLLGSINAFREVVKERAIFLREQRVGVPIWAYLLSKLAVLALIAFIQCLVLTILVTNAVTDMKVSAPALMVHLFVGALAGTCLGLLVSSLVKSQQAAVGLLPIVLVPQLIFNEVVAKNRPKQVDWGLPVAWVYEGLTELQGSNWHLGKVLGALSMPLALGAVFLLSAACALLLAEEE